MDNLKSNALMRQAYLHSAQSSKMSQHGVAIELHGQEYANLDGAYNMHLKGAQMPHIIAVLTFPGELQALNQARRMEQSYQKIAMPGVHYEKI